MIDILEKAQLLVNSLPYIQEYNGKIVVVKYGGNAMVSDELKDAVMADIVLLSLIGIKVVLVHGGGPEINEMLERVGKESKFIDGLRYTDKETADIVQMVLAGKVNKGLVALLQRKGGKALGLCGADGGMMTASKKGGVDLGFVGEIDKIDTAPILDILEKGYIPVISSVATGDDGSVYNINADTVASRLAEALEAENFILMTDIKGLLRDVSDENSLISSVFADEVEKLISDKVIAGGMIPKMRGCVEAIKNGAKKVTIIDGRIPHAIVIEILSNEGVGTQVCGRPNTPQNA